MTKTILFFLVIILSVLLIKTSEAQTSDWIWAKSAGGTEIDYALSSAIDVLGNTYVTGTFNSPNINFDTITLTNAGSYDIFLAKYDTDGNVLWAKRSGGTGSEGGISVAVDASGNAYVAGCFDSQTFSFGSNTLTNADNTGNTDDIFLAKYDAVGNEIWAKSIGGIEHEYMGSVTVDGSDNIYIVGSFSGSSIVFDTTVLINAGSDNMYLAKYDADGNVLWAKAAGGTNYDHAYAVATDVSGNICFAGHFTSPTITFGSTVLTSTGNGVIFIAKYDSNGNALWAKSASGSTGLDYPNSVAFDAAGDAYLAGSFKSPAISFGTSTLTNTNTSGNSMDIFLVKFSENGSVLWAKGAGGSYNDKATFVAADATGNSYLAGWFESDTISFGANFLLNAGIRDIYLAKYDSGGNISWAKSAGGSNIDQANSVVADIAGNIYVTGHFTSPTLAFGSTILTKEGMYDIFLAKIASDNGINEISNPLYISVFPNPSAGNITINISEKSEIEIHNIEGQIIKSISANENNIIIDVSDFAKGMYFVKVMNDKGVIVKKFIKE